MMTTAGTGGISPVISTKSYYPKRTQSKATKAKVSAHYDSVTLSETEGSSKFRMEMLGRISQKVRTVTTTGDIQSLRQAVSDGSYTPDPMAIAAGMLLVGE